MPLNGGGCFNLCVHCAAGEAESEPVRALPSKSKPDGERLLVHSVARKRALTPAGLLGRARAGAAARASATRRSSPRTPPVEASARKEAAQRHARARGRSSIEGRPFGGGTGGRAVQPLAREARLGATDSPLERLPATVVLHGHSALQRQERPAAGGRPGAPAPPPPPLAPAKPQLGRSEGDRAGQAAPLGPGRGREGREAATSRSAAAR